MGKVFSSDSKPKSDIKFEYIINSHIELYDKYKRKFQSLESKHQHGSKFISNNLSSLINNSLEELNALIQNIPQIGSEKAMMPFSPSFIPPPPAHLQSPQSPQSPIEREDTQQERIQREKEERDAIEKGKVERKLEECHEKLKDVITTYQICFSNVKSETIAITDKHFSDAKSNFTKLNIFKGGKVVEPSLFVHTISDMLYSIYLNIEKLESDIKKSFEKYEELSKSNIFKRIFHKVLHFDFKNLGTRSINYEKFANEIVYNFKSDVKRVIDKILECLEWMTNLQLKTLRLPDDYNNKNIDNMKRSSDRIINTINSKLSIILR